MGFGTGSQERGAGNPISRRQRKKANCPSFQSSAQPACALRRTPVSSDFFLFTLHHWSLVQRDYIVILRSCTVLLCNQFKRLEML